MTAQTQGGVKIATVLPAGERCRPFTQKKKKSKGYITPQQIKEDFIMSNYPLWKRDKSNPEILTPQNSFYSEKYCENHFDLYLTTHLYKNENGKFQKY